MHIHKYAQTHKHFLSKTVKCGQWCWFSCLPAVWHKNEEIEVFHVTLGEVQGSFSFTTHTHTHTFLSHLFYFDVYCCLVSWGDVLGTCPGFCRTPRQWKILSPLCQNQKKDVDSGVLCLHLSLVLSYMHFLFSSSTIYTVTSFWN